MDQQVKDMPLDSEKSTATAAEHFDVLIVGAGIAGIGSAYHLQQQNPETRFVVLEAQSDFGGTWHVHTYPGVRSDSDLYTFGYRFKPWDGAPVASGVEIKGYLREVIEDNGLDRHIRYHHKIVRAEWQSDAKRWTVTVNRSSDGAELVFSANFLWMCNGYYRHDGGYTPEWNGMADFKGRIVHPQQWPDDLDYEGKRVVVIGSGATAATLIPSLAPKTSHVTMLQRSPTYFIGARNVNELADLLRTFDIDPAWIHEIIRRQMLQMMRDFVGRATEDEDVVREELIAGVRAFLGEDYDIATHFTPRYRPWQQRIAFVPDGDLFKEISAGRASVETGEIECFTENGILMTSGAELAADIIVTATGFNFAPLSEIPVFVDGKAIDFSKTITYRGMMFTGVPNFFYVFGYFRASYTLRVDVLGDFVCRLLRHMDERGARVVEVELQPEERAKEPQQWVDVKDFSAGYLVRGAHLLPKRLDTEEWQHSQDYWTEVKKLPDVDLDGSAFHYS
jgi:cation diffusion facilitator CzcD-associated flavoprotein CzcO